MGKFSDKVFGANVDQKTIDIFNALQKGKYEFKPNESVTNLPEHTKYLGEKTTFARMWVAVAVSGSDVENDIFYHSINDNKFNSYLPNESISDSDIFTENADNPYLKPNAGITSISSKTEGDLGAVKRTNVEFVVHNKNDFDNIYLPFFLRPGTTVICDFGWSDKNLELYDIGSVLSNADTELKQLKKFIYGGTESGPDGEQIFTNSDGQRYYHSKRDDGAAAFVTDNTSLTPPGFLHKHEGLVDTNIGVVTNYSSKVNQNGSFECSVELVSQNATILDNEISADNNLKFIFANKIEEIIINDLIGVEDPSITLASKIEGYDVLSSSEKQEYFDNFFSGLLLENRQDADEASETAAEQNGETPYTTVGAIGKISDVETKLGIYFEDAGSNNQDSLYISFGKFNDLFLNKFVAKNNNNEERYEINFKLIDYHVRYEKNLYRRQTSILTGNEDLPVFLYPKNWEYSRDAGKNTDMCSVKKQKFGDNPYGIPVIPLREIFINVSIIKQAFNKKQTVNDAINFILQSINEDSFGVINLKMISPNRSYSEIGFQDNNLINTLPSADKLLSFDVTSGNGVVTNMDYSFETPKGDLQNMLAIGSKIDQSIFDVAKLDNLNFLNIMKSKKYEGKNVFITSLPFSKVNEPDDEINETDVDVKQDTNTNYGNLDEAQLDNINASFDDLVKAIEPIAKEKSKKPKPKPKKKRKKKKKQNVLSATSRRDYWGKMARKDNVLKSSTTSTEETISPILPINLTLSVYGNSHLNIGDVFTINFLPKSYTPYLYFQIMGVEHKIDSKWETTYQTQYRVRPSAKKIVISEEIEKLSVKLDESTLTSDLRNSGVPSKIIEISDLENAKYLTLSDDLNWRGEEIPIISKEKTDFRTTILNKINDDNINSPEQVRIAYGFTELMLSYIKNVPDGKKVKYYPRTKKGIGGSYDLSDKRDEKLYDIMVEFNYDGNDLFDSYHTLFDIYRDNQSGDDDENGTDDKDRAKTMFERNSKRNPFKQFITDLNGKNIDIDELFVKYNKEIDKDYAPIISKVKFRLRNDTAEIPSYISLTDIGTYNYDSQLLNSINIPKWFLNGDDPSTFINNFLRAIENTTLPT